MEMENIHSMTELNKVLKECSKFLDDNAPDEERNAALEKLRVLNPTYIAIYDIPKKN